MTDRPRSAGPRSLLRPVVPEEERLGRAFRRLAEEHLATRRRDDAEDIWQRVIVPRMADAGWDPASLRGPMGSTGDAGTDSPQALRSRTGLSRPMPSGQQMAPHGVSPHGVSPHGVSPHGVSPHGVSPHGASPHGASPHGVSIRPSAGARTNATAGWPSGSRSRVALLWESRLLRSGLFAAAAVLLVVSGFAAWPQDGLRYRVVTLDGAEASSYEGSGSQLVATENLETAIDFSDESRVIVEPHTTVRVAVEDQARMVARLSHGTVRVDVEHQEGTDYRFRAGPYEVQVTGTEFALSFEPKTMQMILEMTEGTVVVRDPISGERTVRGGERLELPERVAQGDLADPSQVDSPGVTPDTFELSTLEQEDGKERAILEEDAARDGVSLRRSSVRANFLALAREGKFEAIVTAAQQEGIGNCLTSRSGAELQELAQAARYTGRSALAIRVFEDLAQRHRSSGPGRNAPFFLGRIAEETGQSTKALSLYDNYLVSSPRGLYAAEALGRKMNLVHKTRGAASARPIASEYVKRFPQGAYHALARNLLAGSSR